MRFIFNVKIVANGSRIANRANRARVELNSDISGAT